MRNPALPLSHRARRRTVGLVVVAAFLAACLGADSDIPRAEDVDTGQPPEVTDRERQSFNEPSSGVLTGDQVERYLKTSLLQFDLIRQHSSTLHDQAKRIEERGERGGVVAGLRNVAEAGRMVYQAADVIGGSYVRAARSLGYNPAEMEWVRDRMTEAATYFAAKQLQDASRQGVEQIREQARELERQREAGEQAFFSEEDIQRMLAGADEMEREMAGRFDESAVRNAEVLKRARPNVTDLMWLQVGWHGGGLFAWAGLADPADEETQKQLDEYRRVFEDALNNRVSPGLESDAG